MDFEQWLAEVRRLLVEGGFCPTPQDAAEVGSEEGWKIYFDDGYAPQEAVAEDFSYA